jgi:hypothetical protein
VASPFRESGRDFFCFSEKRLGEKPVLRKNDEVSPGGPTQQRQGFREIEALF